jgi:site-specific recombinase XerD
MTNLKEKMRMDMELRGFSSGTIYHYINYVSELVKFIKKSPELVETDDINRFLHHCIIERKLSEGSINAMHCAIKFFFTVTLKRPWDKVSVPRMKKRSKLPTVLSPNEVMAILDSTDDLFYKTILTTIYGAGLRISEAANLRVRDIDSENMQIIVRASKGKKDRHCILSDRNLKMLREYYKTYRPKDLLFPSPVFPDQPVSIKTVGRIFGISRQKAKINKPATVHSLRHSFATHLLDSGVDIYHIQRLLGHTSITTTTVYLHLRRVDLINIKSPLDTLSE